MGLSLACSNSNKSQIKVENKLDNEKAVVVNNKTTKLTSKEDKKETLATQKEITLYKAVVDQKANEEIQYFLEPKRESIFEYYEYSMIDADYEVWTDKLFGQCCTATDLVYSDILSYQISSDIEQEKYPVENLTDTKFTTAYVFKEGEKPKINIQLILGTNDFNEMHGIKAPEEVLKETDGILDPFKISLINGYVKSEKLFKDNGRVKEMKVLLNGNHQCNVELLDTPLVQEMSLDFVFKKNDVVTFIPISSYKGLKYDDVCISEIQSCLCGSAHPSLNKKYKVYNNE